MTNSQVTQEIIKALNLNVNRERIPEAIPVVEVGTKSVKNLLMRGGTSQTSGTVSISAANMQSADKDLYLMGFSVSMAKNAACDIATGSINVLATLAETGASTNMFLLPCITLTASVDNVIIQFPHPIKISRNTAITLGGTFTAGVCVRSLSVWYYLDDTGSA